MHVAALPPDDDVALDAIHPNHKPRLLGSWGFFVVAFQQAANVEKPNKQNTRVIDPELFFGVGANVIRKSVGADCPRERYKS